MKIERLHALENHPETRARIGRLRRRSAQEPSGERIQATKEAVREALRGATAPECAANSNPRGLPNFRIRCMPVHATVVLAAVGAAMVLTAGYSIARGLGFEWIRAGGDRTVVAKVGAAVITRGDIEQAKNNERFYALAMEMPGSSYAYDPLTSGDLLNRMIEENVLHQEAVRQGFTLSNQQLDEDIAAIHAMMTSDAYEREPFMAQFKEFLGGTDMTYDEYLQKARPYLRRANLISQLRTKVLAGITDHEEWTAVWDKYKADLVRQHQSEIHVYEEP